MGADGLGLAFGAGLVAALNPCGFAMLPAYLTLVVRSGGERATTALARALLATAAMAVGFVAVFGVFGLLTVTAADAVQRYAPYATMVIGFSLAALGIWQLLGRGVKLPIRDPFARWGPTAALGSMFTYGISYALASLSCTVGPFLAVTGIGVGSSGGGLRAMLAYAAGLTLVVGTLAVAAALAGTGVVDRMRRVLPHLNRISGALLVVVGAYVAYYGWYEVQLFSAAGDGTDPVVMTAGRLQSAVAGWVYRQGAWPWVVGLVLLAGATVVWSRRPRVRTDDDV